MYKIRWSFSKLILKFILYQILHPITQFVCFRLGKFNKKLMKCKNVHFMHHSIFTAATIDFINEHFSNKDNLFLVRGNVGDIKQKFPRGDNVLRFFTCRLLNPNIFLNKKLIFHSLFNQSAINWLYDNQSLLKYSYWLVWGGDLYNAPTDEMNTFVRKNIYGVGSLCDNNLIKQKYGSKHVYFDTCMAIAPIDYEQLVNLRSRNGRTQTDTVVIQINNSIDDSTLEMLDVLAIFKDENIHIKTILSYGNVKLKQGIINKGKSIFGNKFSYLDKILSSNKYAEYLAQNDILVLYQNRQQGVGNVIISLLLENKIFIKFDISAAQYFQENEIKIYDSNEINKMNFYDFCEMNQVTKIGNVKNTELLLSNKRRIDEFSAIFNDCCSA